MSSPPPLPAPGQMPPPGPEGLPAPDGPPSPANGRWATRAPRRGELVPAWRIALAVTWLGAFLAYMAVWKASDEIGIATWWLGARSSPQPLIVRLIPFIVIGCFGVLASYNLRRLPWISMGGSLLLAAIAAPDLTRSVGLAAIEFAIAGAVLLVSLASLSGTYRTPAVVEPR